MQDSKSTGNVCNIGSMWQLMALRYKCHELAEATLGDVGAASLSDASVDRFAQQILAEFPPIQSHGQRQFVTI